MRTLALALVAVVCLGASSLAQASPTAPAIGRDDPNIIRVWGGCGWGWHPTPWGGCAPNHRYWNGGGYYHPYWHGGYYHPHWRGYGWGYRWGY